MSSGSAAILPYFSSESKYTLQLPAWYPYEITNDIIYWITYLHQAWGIVVGAAWNTACDTLVAGFFVQTCAQLDIISYRLKMLPQESKLVLNDDIRLTEQSLLRKNILHHLKVLR